MSDVSGRIVAILNPKAGGGRGCKRAEALLAELEGVVVQRTEAPEHATALAREAARGGARIVVAAGGDGTLFEVVNGLLTAELGDALPRLGILAVGTGNSFVRDLHLEDPAAGIAAIRENLRRRVDAIRIEHEGGVLYAINLVSLGFSADAGDLTNRRFKRLGAVGYVAAVLVSVARLHHHAFPYLRDRDPLDGRPVTLLSVCNSQYTGGAMRMAPGADVSDGELEVVRVGEMGRRRFLQSFPKIFAGTHLELREVDIHRAKRVAFEGLPALPVMIDGEIRTLALRAVEVLPRALEVAA
ncbi:MAG: diacylglycerol kinase family protein [Myxococcota bacterium]